MEIENKKKEEIAFIGFNITQQIEHHKNSLRTIDNNNTGLVITGSLDKTCGIFIKQDGKYSFVHSLDSHSDFVYKVLFLSNTFGMLSCGKDKRIIQYDLELNQVAEYIGHESPVNSLSYNKSNPDIFISGSWDGTAKVWDLNSKKCLYTLKDHSYAVTVCSLPDNKFITASNDLRIRFWNKDQNTKNIDNAHELIIRDIKSTKDNSGFYTCSNDQTIKLWNMFGQNLKILSGHEGFIFSIFLQDDLIFSCGDDKIVKVWKGKFFFHK